MRSRTVLAAGALALALCAGACSSTATGTGGPSTTIGVPPPTSGAPAPDSSAVPGSAATTASGATVTGGGGGGVDPNAPEVVAPGDIPDNQAFVSFPAADGSFSVKVPEGWARTEVNGAVTFTDHYNAITIESKGATSAPTVTSVKTTGLADVSTDPTFRLIDVQPVTRKAGDGVVATYEIGSAPDPLTGKKALLAVERYVFFHNGTDAVLTLSGAKGADNVDPWKIVTDSVTWTGG